MRIRPGVPERKLEREGVHDVGCIGGSGERNGWSPDTNSINTNITIGSLLLEIELVN